MQLYFLIPDHGARVEVYRLRDTEMSVETQQRITKITRQVFNQVTDEELIAREIKRTLDAAFGPRWNVVISRSGLAFDIGFGSKNYIYFHVTKSIDRTWWIYIFRSKERR